MDENEFAIQNNMEMSKYMFNIDRINSENFSFFGKIKYYMEKKIFEIVEEPALKSDSFCRVEFIHHFKN